jgi:tetratricopeptide (TPR) repeat protein
MRCRKRENSATARLLRPLAGAAPALLLGIVLAASAASQPQFSQSPVAAPAVPLPQSPPLAPAEHYAQCLDLAHRDPPRAYDDAAAWRNFGGGFPAQHCAAVALVGMKRYADAATEFQTLASAMMSADPQMRGDAMEQAGQAWLLAGQGGKAKLAFDAALTFRPKDPELLVDRAEAFGLSGSLFDAIDDLNAALDIEPNRADALAYRASAYRQIGSLDLALDDADRALKLDPNSVPALLERGNIRRLKGDTAGAAADWKRLIQLAPDTPAAADAKNNITHLAEALPASPPPASKKP